jgi:hypothetical protein
MMMVEIKVGSWWLCGITGKITTVIAIRNDNVTILFPDGSSAYDDTAVFLKDFKHLPSCTGFDWVPASRWFVPTSGGFRDGTLVVEQDQYGKVYAHDAERRSGELKAYQDGTLEQLVRSKEWREIPEAGAAAILEKARNHSKFPEKSDFPAQENTTEQETGKPAFTQITLGNGDIETYYGSSSNGECVMVIRRQEHGKTPGVMEVFPPGTKFPQIQDGDIIIEGSPVFFLILSKAIGLCAIKAASRLGTANPCTGCDCDT